MWNLSRIIKTIACLLIAQLCRKPIFIISIVAWLAFFVTFSSFPPLWEQSSKNVYAQATLNSGIKFSAFPVWFSREASGHSSVAWGDVDNDGDLDLAAGGNDGPIRLYLNDGRLLQMSPAWSTYDVAGDVAWGDVDGDGDLDLAVGGNSQTSSKLYLNNSGTLQPDAEWSITGGGDVAWGDVDGDGDFDLAVSNRLYLNNGKMLDTSAKWSTTGGGAVAWGDVDNDLDLDLAVGNKLYLNDGLSLALTATWSITGSIEALAWGDVDSDGDLDLAVGGYGQTPSRLYLNENKMLSLTAKWSVADSGKVVWGDVDGDNDLDLAVANKIYLNEGEELSTVATWSVANSGHIIALADADGDNDLDFITRGSPIRLYLNETSLLSTSAAWMQGNGGDTQSVAWGDVDGDGDFDLAVGNSDDEGPSELYLSEHESLQTTAIWSNTDELETSSIAWGDIDGDGDLDLAATDGYSPRLYRNEVDGLHTTADWSAIRPTSGDVAWGDMDNDGDLDLAVGGSLYLNEGGMLQIVPTWIAESNAGNSVAWGDVDGDGDLDLVTGGWGEASTQLYINENGMLQTKPVWSVVGGSTKQKVAWGDVDGDGDLDLAIGQDGQPNKLYLNEGGTLQSIAAWSSADSGFTQSIAWGDVEGDGDLDLAVGGIPSKVYVNSGRMLEVLPEWQTDSSGGYSVAWGDVDSDGDLDLARGQSNVTYLYLNLQPASPIYPWPQNHAPAVFVNLTTVAESTLSGQSSTTLSRANGYAVAGIRQSGLIPITYNLFSPGNEPVRAIRVYYSLDGSFSGDRSQWRVAKPALGTQMTDLASTVYPTKTATNTHVFTWDVFGSGFIGQSDNVVIRIEALPNLKPIRNGVPGPFQRPYVATQTFPFRVRGNQVRIINATQANTPAAQAVVYRLPADQTQIALPFTANSSKLLRTDQQGYLQGRGRLEPGDRLFALAPITATDKYTVYHTNGVVTPTGLEGYTVQTGGIQTITVSAANALILYNLTVSLEWDARNDPTFMAQLENDLRRTSQILFDLTNGQAALGEVRIYHDKGFWGTADVVIAASNNQRPNAILGGSVLTPTADVDINGNAIPDAYVPGQVRMGATWNRFGNPNGTLGEDWPRTLAHELGHYLFFVPDNYIGVTPDRQFVQIVDCQGSVMTDPYEESYSEFLTAEQWQTDACQRSVAAVYLGRPDWATITRFYPMLNGRGGNSGPAQLPLAVTRIATFAPPRPATTLAAPFFPLVNQQGQTISVPDGRGQAYLFKTGSNADPTDDYLIALGTPIGDLVQARGAAPGDRLCVFDYASQPLRLGCQSTVGNAPSSITLAEVADWAPQIQVRGLTTNTVIVTVTNVSADNLAVQLLPALGVASPELPMTRQGNAFVQTVTAADGAYFGFIRIWVPGSNPLKELIVEYSATESWDGRARAWGTTADAWGGRARAWGGRAYGWGGRARAWGAPVMSSDGQVSIFPLDNPFASGAQYTLQSVAFPPALPAWLTAVGQAYRIAGTGELAQSAILFSYLGRDVPDGYENFLTIYYSPDEGRSWQRLPTDLDTNRNQASAPVRGTGIYLLAATVPSNPTLAAGWNNLGYPIQRTQLITEALASVAGKYSVVYTYQAAPTPAWQTFAPDVPAPFAALVNDLRQMELGHAYWVYTTAATDLYWGVGPAVTASQAAAAASAPAAPASYYGWIAPGATFTPAVGMRVTATIDGVVCGETTLQLVNGQLGYVIRVAANDPQDALPTCGEAGKALAFTVGDQPMAQTIPWNNQAVQFLALGQTVGVNALPAQSNQLYLPLVRK